MLYCEGEPLRRRLARAVTAKLSRRFYETFGDEIANELVEWFNQVDATYRADLLQINELNISRFDAKLEQRVAQVQANLEQRITLIQAKLEPRITQVQAKLEQRIAQVEAKLEQRITHVEAKLEQRITQVEAKLVQRIADLRAELIKWMFVFWAGTLVPLGGLMLFLVR